MNTAGNLQLTVSGELTATTTEAETFVNEQPEAAAYSQEQMEH